MNITADTNFLISSTQWNYSVAHKLLQKLIRNKFEIFTTKDILEEFANVLNRDFQYNQSEIENILSKVMQFATIITPKIKVQVIKDDPDDDKVIECALESESKYIITYDKHLLKLGKYKGIKIITPEEAILIL
ncbi:MAG: putative toxin-antitoxin system toxin component, PIN family [Nanoarchaeota archaeon]|nr:putative toxin-antitoxin system toxin component, PIN family [Nanoarchaeota archaeon]MBU1321539.1 putative toxin-antitoxin system toxin component, PIN family [Nanoarchaeota archaeon]MBU1597151.1 putative toxin-antitoxin system toxin component, PIN family [Nanoarchaeota archaeon]MBU2441164.1 putative toxin-antitoxin system toxin component, PIN family [Nanoarchaeota archaeon]